MVENCYKGNEVSRLNESISVLIVWITILLKTKICNTEEVMKLIQYVIDKDNLLENIKNNKILAIKKKNEAYFTVVSRTILVGSILVGLVMVLMNIYTRHEVDLKNRIYNLTIERPVMYHSWLPYDANDYPNITLCIQVFACILGCMNNCFSQVFFLAMIVFVISQLQILQLELRELDNLRHNENITNKLKQCISRHQSIIKFVDDFNQALNIVMLIEYVLSSLNVASISVEIMKGGENMANLSFPLIYVILLTLQIFLVASNADEIRLQSVKIADACYECPWYHQDNETKVLLNIMMIRAQKPLSLTIGPFDAMTTPQFLKILKAAYSYITIMMRNSE